MREKEGGRERERGGGGEEREREREREREKPLTRRLALILRLKKVKGILKENRNQLHTVNATTRTKRIVVMITIAHTHVRTRAHTHARTHALTHTHKLIIEQYLR